MAVFDNLFILAAGLAQIFPAMTLMVDQSNHRFKTFLQVLVWPIVHITQLCTVWAIVLVAFYRFVAVCYPFKVLVAFSPKHIKRVVRFYTL